MKGLWTLALQLSGILTFAAAVHLNEVNLRKIKRYFDTGQLSRVRRQVINDPQPWPGPPGLMRVIQVPIPTNIGFFPGINPAPVDNCPRDMVELDDGSCQQPLTRGNCGIQEEVLLDFDTNKGYCAPMLCQVDRIFLPTTQLCHDPKQMNICPPGRELYYSAYGTAVCTCPDGTIEGDDDLDDDVCEVILSRSIQCLYGQVFWFKDFNSPPQCVPDPCSGTNLQRNPNELPFLPSEKDGKCYQLGQSKGVCPYHQFYALNYETLKGRCATLEEAGYSVYDQNDLRTLINIYGPPLPPEIPLPVSQTGFGGQTIFGGSQGSQQNAQIGGHLGQFTGDNIITGNLISNNEFSNQINSNAINGNQFYAGGGDTNQNLPNDQKFHSQNQGQQSNNFISGQQTNINTGQNQYNGQPQPGTFAANNIQNSQNQYSFQQSFGSQQTYSSTQNDFNQPQQLNNFQQTFDDNNQQTYSPNNQNANQNSFSNNNFQQSIEVFGQGSFSPQNNYNTQNQGFSQGQTHSQQPISFEIFGGNDGINSPEVFGIGNQPQSVEVEESYGFKVGRALGVEESPVKANLAAQWHIHPNGEVQHIRTKRSLPNLKNTISLRNDKPSTHSRKKRAPLPHASPSNVFETRLLSCRPGAARDINAKCRNTILPAEIPKSRGTRAAPPTPPTPTCPAGMAFNIRRMCTDSNTAQNSIAANGLG